MGPIGTPITITGSNFGSTPSANIVFFGGVRATVQSATGNSLTAIVPAGAGYQPITVTVNGLTAYSARPFITTFTGGEPIVENINIRQTSFSPQVIATTDLHPNQIAVADLDGDGKPDIATANNYSTTGQPASISLLRNTGAPGTISFSPATNISTGVLTYTVALGDLDGDGKPDMVSSSIADQAIYVFRNNSSIGTISFGTPLSYGTGQDPFRVAIADLDLDGRPDILVTAYLSGFVSIFRNTSSGGTLSFAKRIDITTGLGPRVVAAGDLDGDGKPDIAISNELSNTISVFRNVSTSGNIAFSAASTLTASGAPYGLAIGDLDADGKAELVVVNNTPSTYSIFRNTSSSGAISFAGKVDFACGGSPFDVAIGDVNGDGLPDIAVSSYNLAVAQNNSTPGTIAMSGPNWLFQNYIPFMTAVADLDGDGKNDLAAAYSGDNKIGLFRNRNNEPKINTVTPVDAVAGDIVTISGYDFSGITAVGFGGVPAASFSVIDANTIRAVTGNGASGDVSVTNQYGTGSMSGFTFHAPPVIYSFTPMNAGTGDTIQIKGRYLTGVNTVTLGAIPAASFQVNTDSTLIAVVGNGATGDIYLTTGYGSGSKPGFIYFPQPVITSFTPGGGGIGTVLQITGNYLNGTTSITVGGVAVTSFVVNSPTSVTATVGEGGAGGIVLTTPGGSTESKGSFAFPTPVIASSLPGTGAVGSQLTITGNNFRSDPSADAVFFGAVRATIVSASTTRLVVTVPTGVTFAPITVTANNQTVFAPHPFLATYPPGATQLVDSSFGQRGDFSTPHSVDMMRMADFDGDGLSDLLTLNLRDGDPATLSVLQNKSTMGRPSFVYLPGLQQKLSLNSATTMEIGDLNGDGKPDIVLAGRNPTVLIFKNISSQGVIAFAPPVEYPSIGSPYSITLGDFDGDARTDMIISALGLDNATSYISIYQNIGRDGEITFAPKADILAQDYEFSIANADLDGDGKPDLAGMGNQKIMTMRNTSVPGAISFDAPRFYTGNITQSFAIADADGDGKPDLISAGGDISANRGLLSVLKNNSAPGAISFANKIDLADFPGYVSYPSVYVGQLDGDGKPDLVVMNENYPIALFRNTGSPGNISFDKGPNITPKLTFGFVDAAIVGDVDGDGKADMTIADGPDKTVTIFRNQTGESNIRLCEQASTSILASTSGSVYQWQTNSGNGWIPLGDDSIYGGTATATLVLTSAPYSLSGYEYRCLTDGIAGTITNLTVTAGTRYTGSASLPQQVCADSSYTVVFNTADYMPFNTGIELWCSEGGDAFTKLASAGYPSHSLPFPVKDTTGKSKRYLFRIVPLAAPSACTIATQTDTVSTTILSLPRPVINLKDSLLTIGNPDPAAVYNWQMQDSTGNWSNFAGSTDTTAIVSHTGQYRVMEKKTSCSVISNTEKYVKPIVTGNPPPTSTDSSRHILSYPNPARTTFVLDSLSLSDNWNTLEIIRVADGRRIRTISIVGQTSVTLSVEDLLPDLYVAVLRRNTGGIVTIRFLKM